MTKNHCVLAILISALGLCGCAAKRVSDHHVAEQRYKLVSENLNKLVTGGRVMAIRWSDDGSSVSYARDGKRYTFDLATKTESAFEPEADQPRQARGERRPARGRQRDRVTSPDKKWVAICREWNVVIEPVTPDSSRDSADETNDEAKQTESDSTESRAEPQTIQVTTDGHRKFRYGSASWVYGEELDQTDAMWWSPDSKTLVFYEFDERDVPDHYITANLLDLHTTVLTEGYPKPGEPNPIANLLIYDLETKQTRRVTFPAEEQGEWYTYSVRFTPEPSDGQQSALLFHRTNRHQNVLHVCLADVRTGEARIIITETQDTWQENSPTLRFLKDGHRFIWESERTGYKQYELRDLGGAHLATLTHGDFPVASIVRVDEDAGVLYYLAYGGSGLDACQPLHAQLWRVNLDGSNARNLTQAHVNHSIDFAPDGKHFIAITETFDQPPTSALFDCDGNLIQTLAVSDTSKFHELNMTMPEPFSFMADDGKTRLFGVMYKPSHFNPKKKYPLIVDVYGGPLSQSVRARFVPARAECEHGFIIAQIDNRGTVNRGKAFESATYLRLGDVDLKDQADGVRYLSTLPFIDSSRVGIMGHSYGGYISALALLKYPDVFHVAVAGGTVTDWRNYDTIYTERFMRTPQENPEGYDAGSCLKYAKNLKGNLLLIHGMLDDNVHTNNAWQLIDALQKADLPFEMMFYPEAGHSIGARANRVRWDFLKKHLLN